MKLCEAPLSQAHATYTRYLAYLVCIAMGCPPPRYTSHAILLVHYSRQNSRQSQIPLESTRKHKETTIFTKPYIVSTVECEDNGARCVVGNLCQESASPIVRGEVQPICASAAERNWTVWGSAAAAAGVITTAAGPPRPPEPSQSRREGSGAVYQPPRAG